MIAVHVVVMVLRRGGPRNGEVGLVPHSRLTGIEEQSREITQEILDQSQSNCFIRLHGDGLLPVDWKRLLLAMQA